MTLEVLKPGLQTTIQAGPRTGWRHLGVPSSGAADALSLALANRLVGNRWDAPALEATLLGPTLRFGTAAAFAITGATATASLNGNELALHETVQAEAGDELSVGAMEVGARTYIAIAGGITVEDVLGSASTYLPAGFGGLKGKALERGDRLGTTPKDCASLQTPDEFRLPVSSNWALRACPSFEASWLQVPDDLFEKNWIVGRRADRTGLQLEGGALSIASDGRMPSAAVFPGTVQCPEGGTPYLLSVDAGTVGGYPRVAQVARADRHLLGQLRPGDRIRFLRREARGAIDELRAKLDYWRPWLEDIGDII